MLAAVLLAACSSSTSSTSPGGNGTCTLSAAATLSPVEITPDPGATGVFVGTNISVRFNTCLDPKSISPQGVQLVGSGTLVAGTVRHDAASATVTFDPMSDLAYSTYYVFSLTGVRGANGETLAAPVGTSFRTQGAPELIPPTTAASPPGGRYNATQDVTLTCTDNLGGTGCAATYYTVNGAVPTTASAIYASPIRIAADTTLRFFSVDAQGNAEAPKEEVYVIDTVPPTLTGSDPADGESGVALTTVITATFSEEMTPETLDASVVTVDNGVTVSVEYAAATRTLTIAPTERLACNTTYRVAIGSSALDLAGNALVQPASFGFTTDADCQEPVTAPSVPGGVFTSGQSVTLTCDDAGGSGCARIAYTTDGSIPSLDAPTNGTVVNGGAAGPIALGTGDTVLRYYAEDAAGNREVLRVQTYSISTTGFTFVATDDGLARGVGPVPASFVSIREGGPTTAFFKDPTNGRLYRGTDRGLLVSDGGEAWSFLDAAPGSVKSICARGSKVLVGTSSTLYISNDGGATFVKRDPGWSYVWVPAVAIADHRVFVATSEGVAVSLDKGETFTRRTTADGLGSSSVRDLRLEGGKLYAATAGGLSISTDGGATFTNHVAGLASTKLNAIAVSGDTVYAATEAGLSISSDGGQTFTQTRTTADGLGSDYVGEVVVSGSNVYVATGVPWSSGSGAFAVSANGGLSFTQHTVSPSHPDLGIYVIHVDGSAVRVGAYPAYYLSTDGGITFAPKDLRGSLRRLSGTSGLLVAAVSDSSGYGGVAISNDLGRSFAIRDKADGLPYWNVADVHVDGTNVYAATFSGLGVSTDGGASFVKRNMTSAANADSVWASAETIWVGAGGAIERSSDGGATFQVVQSGTGGGNAIAVSGTNYYVATSGGLWVSNTGENDSFTRKGSADGLENTGLSDVALDGSGTVLAVSSSSGGPTGFYLSFDDGATFSALAGPAMFPRGVHAHGSTWYAATYNSVRISTDGGLTWNTYGTAEGIQASANDVLYVP